MKKKLLNINIPVIQLTVRTIIAGRISIKGLAILFSYYFKMLTAIPSAILQYCLYNKKINKTEINKTPVFILGHYRSGTTLLQKMMCADPRTACINNYDMVCPNSSLLFGNGLQRIMQSIINLLHIKTPFFNNQVPQLNEPAEEDRYLISKGSKYSAYWGFVFPLKWRDWLNEEGQKNEFIYRENWKQNYLHVIKQFTYKNEGKQLVLKNPPNTCRIPELLDIFPDAKFIYISRNPYHLFYSMKNMWMKAILQYSLQKISVDEIEEIIFGHYNFMVQEYEKNKNLIPSDNLIEIKYEDLEADPYNETKNIYYKLNLKGFDNISDNIKNQVKYEKSYTKFKYQYDEITFKKIEKYWSKHIEVWKSGNLPEKIVQYQNEVNYPAASGMESPLKN